MKTNVQPAAENEVALTVDVPAEAVKRAYDRTLAELRNGLELPGFRKGRVPRAMVLSHYGDELVREQTLDNVLPQWGREAMEDAGIYDDAVGTSDLEVEAINDVEADYHFSMHVQMMPTPVLGEYKGLEVPKRVLEVSDEEVQVQLDSFRERLAKLVPVEDRPARSDDFVQIDLEVTRDGQLVDDAQVQNQVFQIGDGKLIAGFEEQLVGMSAGEEKTFDLTFPDDYQVEDLRGATATFKVKAREIKEKQLPALDDAFAADVSEFDTLDEFRADVRKRMEVIAEDGVEREFRDGAVSRALDNATVSVPMVMAEREAERMYHDLEADIRGRGISMEAYLDVIEKTREEALEGMRPGAERLVKRRLVLQAIAAAEGLEVSDDDVVAGLKHDAELMGGDYLQLISEVRKAGGWEPVREELLLLKAIDFIAEHAVATEMTADEAAAIDAAAAHDEVGGEAAVLGEEAE